MHLKFAFVLVAALLVTSISHICRAFPINRNAPVLIRAPDGPVRGTPVKEQHWPETSPKYVPQKVPNPDSMLTERA